MPNPKSTARIAGHPLHPMIVPFPIAFFIGALGCDLTYLKEVNLVWFMFSELLLGAGLVMAVFAAIAGVMDFTGEKRIRNLGIAWLHAGGNIIVVLLEAYNLYMRYTTGPVSMDTGLILSVIAVITLLGTGWLGGEMVFRYGVGVADHPVNLSPDLIMTRHFEAEVEGHFPYPPPDRHPVTGDKPLH